MSSVKDWDPVNTSFFLTSMGLVVILVPPEFRHSLAHPSEWIFCLGMVALVQLGISIGYHRLFTHHAFTAAWPLRAATLCLGAWSLQRTALIWACQHRNHHRYEETERDPHDFRRGFWYAHWLWAMERKPFALSGGQGWWRCFWPWSGTPGAGWAFGPWWIDAGG